MAPTADHDPFDHAQGGDPLPRRVLIVEDEALIALSLQVTLEEAGYEVTGIALTLADALAAAATARPDLAIVDLNLRDGRTGLSVAESLAARHGCRVILATGNPDDVVAGPAVSGVVAKPYGEREMLRAVRAALAGHVPHDRSPARG